MLRARLFQAQETNADQSGDVTGTMLTLFSVPKPFEGHIGTIQRNAIASWTRLVPPCRIVLLGSESGTREAAQDHGIDHVPNLTCNEFGTPLVNDIFERAEAVAPGHHLCYINADIILLPEFMPAFERLADSHAPFLMVGRRTDLDVNQDLEFSPGWEDRLRHTVSCAGKLHAATGIDYFVYQQGLFGAIPPFALGRTFWDNWLLFRARSGGVRLIDATEVVLAIHQNHHYGDQGKDWIWEGPEAQLNRELGGSIENALSIDDSTHFLTRDRLKSALLRPPIRRKFEVAAALHPRWRWLARFFLTLIDSTFSIRSRLGLTNVGTARRE